MAIMSDHKRQEVERNWSTNNEEIYLDYMRIGKGTCKDNHEWNAPDRDINY